ncbi:MAG: hypothetical protein Q9162_004376 [Coniocarpon cinnabarinum]
MRTTTGQSNVLKGGSRNLQLTAATHNSFRDGILDKDLPTAIQEAVIFSRLLGIKFLWVDSLCIIQDSEQDKHRQIRNMRDIFKNSYLTIVASQSFNVFQGFLKHPAPFCAFKQETPRTFLPKWLSSPRRNELFLQFQKPRFWGSFQEPISKRAWTLEEYLLSQRLVMFTAEGPVWECHQTTVDFNNNYGRDVRYPNLGHLTKTLFVSATRERDPVSVADLFKAWRTIVGEYTARLLTHPRDKLPAIHGVANEISRARHLDMALYCAGTWAYDAIEEILWTIYGPMLEYAGDRKQLRRIHRPARLRPRGRRMLSWSWAASDSPIIFFSDSQDDHVPYRRIFNVLSFPRNSTTSSEDIARKEERLCLECWTFEVQYSSSGNMTITDPDWPPSLSHTSSFLPDFRDEPEGEEKAGRLCILLAKDRKNLEQSLCQGIVVTPLDSEGSKFQRVGWFCEVEGPMIGDIERESGTQLGLNSSVANTNLIPTAADAKDIHGPVSSTRRAKSMKQDMWPLSAFRRVTIV